MWLDLSRLPSPCYFIVLKKLEKLVSKYTNTFEQETKIDLKMDSMKLPLNKNMPWFYASVERLCVSVEII